MMSSLGFLLFPYIILENTICNDETHTCQSCDMKQLEALSTMLMDLFYGAYTARYSAKDLKVLKVIKMKNLFVDALMKANNVRSFDFNSVAQMMVEFANSQKPRSHNTLARFNPADAFCRQVEQHFPLLERWGLARATLRKYDSMHEYHCNINFCGASCPFAVQRCPHEGCQVRFSKRWWGEHDAVCPFKIVPCPLLCGMFVARRSTQEHTANSCIMRPVPCPYARIGCNPPGTYFHVLTILIYSNLLCVHLFCIYTFLTHIFRSDFS